MKNKSHAIKRLTILVKSLNPLLTRIPNRAQRPHVDKEKQAAFDKSDSRRVDKATIRFFANQLTNADTRRVVNTTNAVIAV